MYMHHRHSVALLCGMFKRNTNTIQGRKVIMNISYCGDSQLMRRNTIAHPVWLCTLAVSYILQASTATGHRSRAHVVSTIIQYYPRGIDLFYYIKNTCLPCLFFLTRQRYRSTIIIQITKDISKKYFLSSTMPCHHHHRYV